jgi:hypothetical protein
VKTTSRPLLCEEDINVTYCLTFLFIHPERNLLYPISFSKNSLK